MDIDVGASPVDKPGVKGVNISYQSSQGSPETHNCSAETPNPK